MLQLLACALLLGVAPAAAGQPPLTVAVLSLADHAGVDEDAEKVRAALVAQHVRTISLGDTRKRLTGTRAGGDVQDEEILRARLQQAEDARTAAHADDAVELANQIINSLEDDPQFTPEKAAILASAHVTAAASLLASAGRKENGTGNTAQGKAAQHHLAACVASDAAFSLDVARYPPRLRNLLDRARADVGSQPRGRLEVTSSPPGAAVYLEGRRLGLTPLRLADVAPLGRWRVWLEYQGHRSLQRVVDIKAQGASVHADLTFEGALQPRTASIDAELADLTPALLQTAADLLGAKLLAVVLARPSHVGVVVFDADRGVVIRRGMTRRSDAAAHQHVAHFIHQGAVSGRFTAPQQQAPKHKHPLKVLLVGEADGRHQDAFRRGATEGAPLAFVTGEESPGVAACKMDVECLLNQARPTAADALVLLQVAPGSQTSAEAAWWDVATRKEVRRVRLERPAAVWTPEYLRALAVWLLVPDQATSTLAVQAPSPGMSIFLDGYSLGQTPLHGDPPKLQMGSHLVRATRPGFKDAEAVVEVLYGHVSRVTVGAQKGALSVTSSRAEPLPLRGVAPSRDAAGQTQPAADAAPKRRSWAALGVAGAGIGLGLLGPAAAVVGAGLAGAGAAWVASFKRAPSGDVVAQPGESAGQLTARIGAAWGLVAGGAGVAALGALVLLVALGTTGAGLVWWLVG